MTNNHYIYFHINPVKNEIFYVGKGSNQRAWSKRKRNPYWHHIVNKYGYIINIVEENLTKEESNQREIFYIQKIGRKDLGQGPLVNMTAGGDGGDTYTNNPNLDQIKKKISKTLIGNKHTKNHILTDSHKKNISIGLGTSLKFKNSFTEERNKKISEAHKGKKKSDEAKRKMSEAKKGSIPWNKGLTYKILKCKK